MSQEINLDFNRAERTGLSETVLCSNKTIKQLQCILDLLQENKCSMLFTRLEEVVYSQLKISNGFFDYDQSSKTSFYYMDKQETLYESKSTKIAIVTGGSSDIPIAREASRTLEFFGQSVDEFFDVGVAGLWRLEENLTALKSKKIIICIAGMDAALPTVLGGLVPALIIAVPSSVGYGVAREGETALNALLCSCAQGLVVVNIDNGFGAACAALRVLNSDV